MAISAKRRYNQKITGNGLYTNQTTSFKIQDISAWQCIICCIYFNQRACLFGIGVIPTVQGSIFWHLCKISNATNTYMYLWSVNVSYITLTSRSAKINASSSPVYILNIAKISNWYVDYVLINMSNERLIAITLICWRSDMLYLSPGVGSEYLMYLVKTLIYVFCLSNVYTYAKQDINNSW